MASQQATRNFPVSGLIAKMVIMLLGLAFGLLFQVFPSLLQAGITGVMLTLTLAATAVWQARASRPTRAYTGVITTLCVASFVVPAIMLGTVTIPMLIGSSAMVIAMTVLPPEKMT